MSKREELELNQFLHMTTSMKWPWLAI